MRSTLNPGVRISGTGAFLPDRVVDNVELGRMIGNYDESRSGPFHHWVDQVTHIHRRRFAEPGTRASDLGLEAARRALDSAGVAPEDLGLIIFHSFTPSQILPGDHAVLAEELGARNAGTFLAMAACAGSAYGLGLAYGMIVSGVYDHVLIVCAETISRVLNFHDPITAIIFGDGAGAAVVSRHDGSDGKGMLPPHLGFEYSPHNIHQGNSNVGIDVPLFPDREIRPGIPLVEQSVVEMEGGPSVLRRAVQNMAGSTVRCLGYTRKDLKRPPQELRETLDRAWIIPHQANGRIIDGMVDRLGVPPERVIRTIYEYGNISAATNLIGLDYAIRTGNMERELDEDGHVVDIVTHEDRRIREGDLVLMPSIGGGYVSGCVGFVF